MHDNLRPCSTLQGHHATSSSHREWEREFLPLEAMLCTCQCILLLSYNEPVPGCLSGVGVVVAEAVCVSPFSTPFEQQGLLSHLFCLSAQYGVELAHQVVW